MITPQRGFCRPIWKVPRLVRTGKLVRLGSSTRDPAFDSGPGRISRPRGLNDLEPQFSVERQLRNLCSMYGTETVRQWVADFETGFRVEKKGDHYVVERNGQGKGWIVGSSTFAPTTREHYETYQRWYYLVSPVPYSERRAFELMARLRGVLEARKVELWFGYDRVYESTDLKPHGREISEAGFAMNILEEFLLHLPSDFLSNAGVKVLLLYPRTEVHSGGQFEPESARISLNEYGLTISRQIIISVLFRVLTEAWGHRIDQASRGQFQFVAHEIPFPNDFTSHLRKAVEGILQAAPAEVDSPEGYRIVQEPHRPIAKILAAYILNSESLLAWIDALPPGSPSRRGHEYLFEFIRNYIFRGKMFAPDKP